MNDTRWWRERCRRECTWAGELVVDGVGSLAGRGRRVGGLRADRVQRDLAGQNHRPGRRHHLLQEPAHNLTLTTMCTA